MSVNKVILVGNLGKDPEVRQTNGGTQVATLRLATTERRKGTDGQWTDHTEWHTVTAWGKTAEFLQKYVTKGRQLYVEGRLQTREWTDKENSRRYSTEVVADTIHALGGRGEGGGGSSSGGGGGGGGGSKPHTSQGNQSNGGDYSGGHPFEEGIPF